MMHGRRYNKIASNYSPEIRSINIIACHRYNKDVNLPMGSFWRGLLIGVRDEGVGLCAPTLRGEKPFILQKGVSLSANLFLEIFFLFTSG